MQGADGYSTSWRDWVAAEQRRREATWALLPLYLPPHQVLIGPGIVIMRRIAFERLLNP